MDRGMLLVKGFGTTRYDTTRQSFWIRLDGRWKDLRDEKEKEENGQACTVKMWL